MARCAVPCAPARSGSHRQGSFQTLNCHLFLMIIHIECTDQEFSECHFLKLIYIVCSTDPGFTSVKLFWSATLFLWGKKIYFGRFLCLYCPLLKKKKKKTEKRVSIVWFALYMSDDQDGRWCLRGWPRGSAELQAQVLSTGHHWLVPPRMLPEQV